MLINFLRRYKISEIFLLILEDHIQFLVRNIPSYEGILIRRFFYKAIFKKIGKGSLIFPGVYITHAYNIKIGENFASNYGSHIDGRGKIVIGDNTLVGPNTFIGSSNHFIKKIKCPRIFQGHVPKNTTIGSNVWIGANCVICPGIEIKNNSIIAAGSVVTKNVEKNCIYGGNPAKLINYI